MSESHIDKFNSLAYPFIIPVQDSFKLKQTYEQGKFLFAIVTHPLYKDAQDAISFIESLWNGEKWMQPTVKVAGQEWKINPKYSEDGWTWLLLKA